MLHAKCVKYKYSCLREKSLKISRDHEPRFNNGSELEWLIDTSLVGCTTYWVKATCYVQMYTPCAGLGWCSRAALSDALFETKDISDHLICHCSWATYLWPCLPAPIAGVRAFDFPPSSRQVFRGKDILPIDSRCHWAFSSNCGDRCRCKSDFLQFRMGGHNKESASYRIYIGIALTAMQYLRAPTYYEKSNRLFYNQKSRKKGWKYQIVCQQIKINIKS